MWDRADELLQTPGFIVQAPGYDALMVQHAVCTHSQAPHLIKSTKSGKFVCDCNPYKSLKICEHTLAALELLGKLRLFLDWRKRDNTTVNITNLVMSGISSGRKPPVSKPRKGGRTPLGKEKPLLEVTRDPIAEDTSTIETLEALGDMEKDDRLEVIYFHQTKAIKCYGCGNKFIREKEQNNLSVRKYCAKEYTVAGERKTKNQFAYLHLKTACLVTKLPDYKKDMLGVSKESIDMIPKEVKDMLVAMGVRV